MKRFTHYFVALASCFLMVSGAHAVLINVGGGMIYDSDQDITWLQDANFALTNGDDADGLMNWAAANAWAAGLVVGGFTDWRLPTTTQPDPTCAGQSITMPPQGFGADCTGSEMGHLANVDGISSVSQGPFTNVQESLYWSSTEFVEAPADLTWAHSFGNPFQTFGSKLSEGHAWAVRGGNVPEICDNGIDDDLDGLTDTDDPDCAPPPPEPVGLQVRCMHKPVYPQAGEEVRLTAQAIDEDGSIVVADSIEIFLSDLSTPFAEVNDLGSLQDRFTPAGGSFGYGCRAVRGVETAQSWYLPDPKLRSVDVGGRNNPDWEAQPVLYNGPSDEKIDIVFFHDDSEYTSYLDPKFLSDVHDLVNDGLWTIPWFVKHQWVFNIWIARADTADAGPKSGPIPPNQTFPNCRRERPERLNKDYAFRDAGGIVHRSSCRDNAGSPRLFTIQATGNPQVVAHEMGHRPFGMKDEYCRLVSGASFCDGGHGQNNPFANLYKTENGCRNSAAERPYDADDCRLLIDANNGKTWWLGEPPYANLPVATQTRDLMQQTGSPGYKVGKTEINRMMWYVDKCLEGKC